MDRSHRLGDLQYAIMRVLWERGEATVAQVHEDLGSSRALTTVATMLTKLEKKGAVSHRTEGRQFVYAASISKSDVRSTMVGDLAEQLFQGDASALVSHLIQEGEIDTNQLDRLSTLIDEARKNRGEES